MRLRLKSVIALSALLAGGGVSGALAHPADTILTNGKIVTLNAQSRVGVPPTRGAAELPSREDALRLYTLGSARATGRRTSGGRWSPENWPISPCFPMTI